MENEKKRHEYWEGIDNYLDDIFDVPIYNPINIIAPNVQIAATVEINENSGSNVISREISDLRYRYLLGKLTGKELTDNLGKVIVAKNNVITKEIVDSVESAGKLPELIVNMIYAESDEENT